MFKQFKNTEGWISYKMWWKASKNTQMMSSSEFKATWNSYKTQWKSKGNQLTLHSLQGTRETIAGLQGQNEEIKMKEQLWFNTDHHLQQYLNIKHRVQTGKGSPRQFIQHCTPSFGYHMIREGIARWGNAKGPKQKGLEQHKKVGNDLDFRNQNGNWFKTREST